MNPINISKLLSENLAPGETGLTPKGEIIIENHEPSEPIGTIITKYATEYLRSIGGYSTDVPDEGAAFVKWLLSNKNFKNDLVRIINKEWVDYIANFGVDLAHGASLDTASAGGGIKAVGQEDEDLTDKDPADWWKDGDIHQQI